ncbi:protein IQ-DOMAIN 9-like isoform X2 [Mangifera indica]|nr:protein IQ-DOMAIN 9-like isoform X2 [Mangifera indica]
MARKSLRRLKGIVRLQAATQRDLVKNQASTTLSNLHAWSKIQGEIHARRLNMVMEGRLKQKKLENQLKLEAKLHDLEVEWSGGSETMDEILSRIQEREEASIKRERAMAYAFSHQWRANSDPLGFRKYELGKSDWGWSWKERWIAARPWESRVPPKLISPKKVQLKQVNKVGENMNSPFKSKSPKKVLGQRNIDKNKKSPSEFKSPKMLQQRQARKVGENMNSPTQKSSGSVKPPMPNGRGTTKGRRLSFPDAKKSSPGGNAEAEGTNTEERTKNGQRLSFPTSEKPFPGGNAKAGKTNTKEITTKGRRLSFPAAEKLSPGGNATAGKKNTKEITTKGRRLSFPAAKKLSPGGNAKAGKANTKEITTKGQRLSFPGAEKQSLPEGNTKAEEATVKEQSAS